MRLTIWRDLMKIDQWKDACDRPMAVAMAVLPQDSVVHAENDWNERREGNKVVALSGYVKVPETEVARFEALSGTAGIFV
eukprot:4251008-Alexandrium_andersonii.AAC.1